MNYKRNIYDRLVKGLSSSPIVLLVGPRQSGKTTLTQEIAKTYQMESISFDEMSFLAASQIDPVGFLKALKKPIVLDEVQRAPQIFLPLKSDVDSNQENGRYLLTGSANPLLVPHLGDALTGRMLIYPLWPFSQGELAHRREDFINEVFSEDFGAQMSTVACSKEYIMDLLFTGGFPRLQHLLGEQERHVWCDSYLSSALQKDITDLAKIEGLARLPSLIYILASRVGSTMNISDVGRSIGTPATTLHRYLQLLHSLFLLYTLPSWSRNLSKRVIKAPKVYLTDTALLLHALHFNKQQLLSNPTILGGAVENFVLMELVKQSSWSDVFVKLYHFKASNAVEVDIVLEDKAGNIVGIEVKFSETIQPNDFKGLHLLKEASGDKFKRGVVLYVGDKILPFGDKMHVIPISKLWN